MGLRLIIRVLKAS